VSPRTRLTPLLGAALLAACGAPPQPLPSSPPYDELPRPSYSAPSPPVGLPTVTGAPVPTGLVPTPGIGGYPGYPGQRPPPPPTTAGPTTRSPTSTPPHAPRCTGQPTGAQILTLVKGTKGIPKRTLKVVDGPNCASNWSFTTIGEAGKTADQQEPLYVVAYGAGAGLMLVTAGSDVCNDPVQKEAPPGIRVLACGF
jgi:hypothetical protein